MLKNRCWKNHSVLFFLVSVALISPEIYLKRLFSSFIKYPQSLPVDIWENYPKMSFSGYDASSDNSEVCIIAELKNLRLFILMILRLKKVFAHCMDIVDSDYNRIRMRNQLARKRTLNYLAKVSLNGSVFAFEVIHRWIEPYCIYSNFRYSTYFYPTNIKFPCGSIVWITRW